MCREGDNRRNRHGHSRFGDRKEGGVGMGFFLVVIDIEGVFHETKSKN